MNYRPTVTATGEGRYRADGLMLHMAGKWELVFEVRARIPSSASRADHPPRMKRIACPPPRAVRAGARRHVHRRRGAQDPVARALARAVESRSEQPRLGKQERDRPRRAPVLRAAPLGERRGSPARAAISPSATGATACRARCGLKEVDRNAPSVVERPLPPLVRLGRRARQPVGAEHQPDPRSARAGDERGERGEIHPERPRSRLPLPQDLRRRARRRTTRKSWSTRPRRSPPSRRRW